MSDDGTAGLWWTPRYDDEATPAYLARVLDELGTQDLAARARKCHFDDYLCPDEVDDGANIHRLVAELGNWARSASRDQRLRARMVIAAATDGEFDGTREESARWAQSPDGAQALRELATDGKNDDLWVRSEVMPDGSYGVGINVGPDRSWALNRTQAVAYAVACYTRATEAEHDAAVFALLTKQVGMPDGVAGAFIAKDIRPDRPDDHTATEPLQFTTALGRKVGPFIKMILDGRQVGELSPADLRGHAEGVLNALAAADLDAALLRLLTGVIGLDDGRARAVVGSLAEHWPTKQSPREE